ncbi:transposase [Pelomonas cellulosilytica]|uniref:transposase n=1 Tax=Pelomonas cellulosilytica TaxID=2906762 RepID=UPI001F231311
MHSAEFKAKVLAQCAQPGASIAAVAMTNGLNANLVRKWLAGRGLKREGLTQSGAGRPAMSLGAAAPASLPAMRFVPVELADTSRGDDAGVVPGPAPTTEAAHIEVELRRGAASLAVRWPASQASGCAGWLREWAGVLLQG